MPGFPVLNYLTIAFFVGVLVVLMFQADTRISVIGTAIFVLLLLVAYNFTSKKAAAAKTQLDAK